MKFGEWRPQKGYLPALSIQQPWAWLIVHGLKDIENRDWRTSYRGPLLIHAGKEIDKKTLSRWLSDHIYPDFPAHLKRAYAALPDGYDYPTGGIVGIATLVDIVTESRSPWFSGKYGFVLKDARPLSFIGYKGTLGLFSVPESVLGTAAKQKVHITSGQYAGHDGTIVGFSDQGTKDEVVMVRLPVLGLTVPLRPNEFTKQDETLLRARNIPSVPPRDLDNAYAQVQELAKAEERKNQPSVADFWALPPKEQYQVQQQFRQERKSGRCVIEVDGKFI